MLWLKNNKLIVQNNQLIHCPECPCGVVNPPQDCNTCNGENALVSNTWRLVVPESVVDGNISGCDVYVGTHDIVLGEPEGVVECSGRIDFDDANNSSLGLNLTTGAGPQITTANVFFRRDDLAVVVASYSQFSLNLPCDSDQIVLDDPAFSHNGDCDGWPDTLTLTAV